MERYHIYKLGLAILFYAVFCRTLVVYGLNHNNAIGSSNHSVETTTQVVDGYYVYYQGVEGTPGVDFPILSHIPRTTFSCKEVESGYYADLDTDCQVFHICNERKKVSFLCPNGTIFQQADLICDWWFKVNCTNSPSLYEESAEQLRVDEIRRKESRKVSHNTAHPNQFGVDGGRQNVHDNTLAASRKTAQNDYHNHNSERTITPQSTNRGKAFREHSNSEESQIPQETASFYKNTYNNIHENKKASTAYPNHRSTYSELKDPKHYYTTTQAAVGDSFDGYKTTINNGRPFVSTTPQSTLKLNSRGDGRYRSEGGYQQQNNQDKFASSTINNRQNIAAQTTPRNEENTLPSNHKPGLLHTHLINGYSKATKQNFGFSANLNKHNERLTSRTTSAGDVHNINQQDIYSNLGSKNQQITTQFPITNNYQSSFVTSKVSENAANLDLKTENDKNLYGSRTVDTYTNKASSHLDSAQSEISSVSGVSTRDSSTLTTQSYQQPSSTIIQNQIVSNANYDVSSSDALSTHLSQSAPENKVSSFGVANTHESIKLTTQAYKPSETHANRYTPSRFGYNSDVTGSNKEYQPVTNSDVIKSDTYTNKASSYLDSSLSEISSISTQDSSKLTTLSYQPSQTKTSSNFGVTNDLTSTTKQNQIVSNTPYDVSSSDSLSTQLSQLVPENKVSSLGVANTQESIKLTTQAYKPSETHANGYTPSSFGYNSDVTASNKQNQLVTKSDVIKNVPENESLKTLDLDVYHNTPTSFGLGKSVSQPEYGISSVDVSKTVLFDSEQTKLEATKQDDFVTKPNLVPDNGVQTTIKPALELINTQNTEDRTANFEAVYHKAPNYIQSAQNERSTKRENLLETSTSSSDVTKTIDYSAKYTGGFISNSLSTFDADKVSPLSESSTVTINLENSPDISSTDKEFLSTTNGPTNTPDVGIVTGFYVTHENTASIPKFTNTVNPSTFKASSDGSAAFTNTNNRFGDISTVPTSQPISTIFSLSSIANEDKSGNQFVESTSLPPAAQSTIDVYSSTVSSISKPKPFEASTFKPESPEDLETLVSSNTHGLVSKNDNELSYTYYSKIADSLPSTTASPAYALSSASPFARSTLGPVISTNSIFTIPTEPTPFATPESYNAKDNLHNMINTLTDILGKDKLEEISEKFADEQDTPRPGLLIPPSAGPQTLHTLAVYFANALDDIMADHTERNEEGDLIKEINESEVINELLSRNTVNKYKELFKEIADDNKEETEDVTEHDLDAQHSKNPVESPRVRHLAQMFTKALSSYLDDPEGFRNTLKAIRPSEPAALEDNVQTVVHDEKDEVLKFSDGDTSAKFDLASRFVGLPEARPTWGYILVTDPQDNALDNESLQKADSQSFVSQLNTLNKDSRSTTESAIALPTNHWTSSPDVTKLWQTTLQVNPHSINQKLDANKETPSSEESTTEASYETDFPSFTTQSSEIRYELHSLPKLELNETQIHGLLIDFVNTTKLDEANKLTRILHKLNTTQEEFLGKMQEIEKNPLTRRLILLLISECEANSDTKHAAIHDILQLTRPETSETLEGSSSSDIRAVASVHNQKVEDQDARALELLNSLYTIASRYGK